jgi:hypothetical protein
MTYSKDSFIISSLVVGIVVLALSYILEVNSLSDGQHEIVAQRKQSQELMLSYQDTTKRLSFIHKDQELELLREKFNLEPITAFTLLEPQQSQLSLSPR